MLNVAADAYAQIWFGTVISHSVVISEEPGCFLIGAVTPTVSCGFNQRFAVHGTY